MREHDRVVLTVDLDGKTVAVLTVAAEHLSDVGHDELTHARQIGAD
jgi:hypothetical protein